MTKQEEVKEIMLAIPQTIVAYDGNPKGQHLYGEQRQQIAEELYDVGYRKVVWHKVADGDLPKSDSVVLTFVDPGYYAAALYLKNADDKLGRWHELDRRIDDDVIAWAELPEYKGVEE